MIPSVLSFYCYVHISSSPWVTASSAIMYMLMLRTKVMQLKRKSFSICYMWVVIATIDLFMFQTVCKRVVHNTNCHLYL